MKFWSRLAVALHPPGVERRQQLALAHMDALVEQQRRTRPEDRFEDPLRLARVRVSQVV
jgi:hypothetical protein